jgi:hypothetical protein
MIGNSLAVLNFNRLVWGGGKVPADKMMVHYKGKYCVRK